MIIAYLLSFLIAISAFITQIDRGSIEIASNETYANAVILAMSSQHQIAQNAVLGRYGNAPPPAGQINIDLIRQTSFETGRGITFANPGGTYRIRSYHDGAGNVFTVFPVNNGPRITPAYVSTIMQKKLDFPYNVGTFNAATGQIRSLRGPTTNILMTVPPSITGFIVEGDLIIGATSTGN
jgi:hypothetical protein